jgi:hypothetical protein
VAVDEPDIHGGQLSEDDVPGVANITTESRQVIDQNGLIGGSPSVPDSYQQALQLGPVDAGTACRSVGVLGDDPLPVLRSERPTSPQLVLD